MDHRGNQYWEVEYEEVSQGGIQYWEVAHEEFPREEFRIWKLATGKLTAGEVIVGELIVRQECMFGRLITEEFITGKLST
jgi:hypothetical protein